MYNRDTMTKKTKTPKRAPGYWIKKGRKVSMDEALHDRRLITRQNKRFRDVFAFAFGKIDGYLYWRSMVGIGFPKLASWKDMYERGDPDDEYEANAVFSGSYTMFNAHYKRREALAKRALRSLEFLLELYRRETDKNEKKYIEYLFDCMSDATYQCWGYSPLHSSRDATQEHHTFLQDTARKVFKQRKRK